MIVETLAMINHLKCLYIALELDASDLVGTFLFFLWLSDMCGNNSGNIFDVKFNQSIDSLTLD